MSTSFSVSSALRRILAVAVVAGSAFAVAGAQVPAAPSSADAAQPVNFQLPLATATSSTAPAQASDALFSSSVTADDAGDAATTAANTNLATLEKNLSVPGVDAQYGRRRYGAPRYRGSNTNADGSEKYTAFAGGGFTAPLGDQHKYDTVSWGFQVGVGRNFNKNLGVNLEFNWDEFGLQGSTIQQQTYIYDPTGSAGLQGYLDGYSHIWSFSVSPIYNIRSGEGLGAYVTAGAGFYHKITTFTVPEEEEILTYFGPEEYEANAPIDSYTSNAPGVDAGFGLTYKFSHFANERLYAEARYVVTFNSQRTGINGSNYNNYAPDYDYPTPNVYPANSNRSTYLPVKFGIRF